tara:strand:- start:2196 stop:2657 length:462 start_codon:yes stop_codon:yes gene_type:complete
MTTVTPTFPILQQNKAPIMMNSYADAINQQNPQVSIPTQDIPIVVDDPRMKNHLFLLHPNIVENIDYTFSPPPPPRRFKLQCLQDFIDKVRNKDDDEDDDEYDIIDDCYYDYHDNNLDDDPLYNAHYDDLDDAADADAAAAAAYENEQQLDIE